MTPDSAESLLQSLRSSGLFTPQAMAELTAELQPLGSDLQLLMRHLVSTGRITPYQLRKVMKGRSGDLFIGPYVVEEKLGEGGMGKVFKARHKRLDRVIALKVVREATLAKPTARGRYEREVQAALALHHPNIVEVFSAGSTGGQYYLEMEFVDGLDVARIVQRFGPLAVAEACEYVRQAALGLHHAHELGFVHRDIKPSNILVSGERHLPDAKEPACVKILDMGLVRTVGEEEGERGLTRDGTAVGTPDYMAPEQAKNSRLVDRRADLYSLGATFFFMLSGRPPFPEGSALDKIISHVDEAPPLVSSVRNDVPDDLVKVIDRLMAKSPDQRYATAKALAECLKPYSRLQKDPAGTAIKTNVEEREAVATRGESSVRPESWPKFLDWIGPDRRWILLGLVSLVLVMVSVLAMLLS